MNGDAEQADDVAPEGAKTKVQEPKEALFCRVPFEKLQDGCLKIASAFSRALIQPLLPVNGNRSISSTLINEKYQIGKVIGDGNFAVVKECVER